MSRSAMALGVAWLSYLALLLQQTLDAGLNGAPGIIWAFKLVPLLVFLPGMCRGNPRTFIWLSFVSLGYFTILVQRLFAQPHSPLVICGLTAVVILFISAMLFVRWRVRERHAGVE